MRLAQCAVEAPALGEREGPALGRSAIAGDAFDNGAHADQEAGSFDSDVVAADIVQTQEARIGALERLVGGGRFGDCRPSVPGIPM